MTTSVADTVVKVGGALLDRSDAVDSVVRSLVSAAARGGRILVVPGGGPFADTVRAVDSRLGLEPSVAHWMAVLAMEQYAHLLASRARGCRLVRSAEEAAAALAAFELPVLAPYRWLRSRDPLPHTWDVTSDSVAAWLAGEVGANRLILVKPVVGARAALVDAYFERALPQRVQVVIVDADGVTEALRAT
jgi:aspartokinase-like uncharacterized kinase